ncbi:MAG TPA: peptide-methionine (S)-S-oxide reductase MsrA [Burkholderiaceae bacterium]|nr:peptide-methionine (S)-S-oxide reductase MsrA [Burkholderiaceae bacterium]
MSIRNPLATMPSPGHKFATFAGGCFWCLEAVFEELDGVIDVESGYSNGHTQNPDYRQVCSGETGYAEVVRIEFDPARITYRELLEVFFAVHDPTTLNRQGNDVGSQYRSAIFYHDEEQKATASQFLQDAQSSFEDDIVTQLEPVDRYFRAETYHQEYFRHNTNQGYCMFVIGPKLEKFRRAFARKRRVGVSSGQ